MAVTFEKNKFPTIWVVNLKASSERRYYITRHLEKLGLGYELVEGIDGSSLSEEEQLSVYSPEKSIELLGRKLSPGEIGCSLSHIKLYEKMIEEGIEEAIILEDDAQFIPDCIEIIGKRPVFPLDWELILLCHRKKDLTYISYWKKKKVYKHYKIVKFVSAPWGTCGYMIRQSAAEKLLSRAYPVSVPADTLTNGGVKSGVHLYGIHPPCILQSSFIDATYPAIPQKNEYKAELRRKWAEYEARPLYAIARKLINLYKKFNPRYII